MMKFFALIFSVLCLAACSSPEANAPQTDKMPPAAPAAQTPSADPTDTRPAIVAFGDSLSAGYGVDPAQSYPAHLQRLIDEAGHQYRVVNAGISGDTTSSGVARVASVAAMKPVIVILELGGNDGLRGLPLEATRANLEEMVVTLKQAGAKVVLAGMTLPPNYGSDYISGFEQIYRDLAAAHGLPLIPFLLEGVATDPKLMQSDGIHPTAEGNRLAAANVMETLAPFL